MSPITTHPRLVRADRVRSQPAHWTRNDTLYVLLVIGAIVFCACVGLFAL